jgi:hypothetical protein
MFPEEDVRRRYDMKETRLATNLGKCIGKVVALKDWNGDASSGCLGDEVSRILEGVSGYFMGLFYVF